MGPQSSLDMNFISKIHFHQSTRELEVQHRDCQVHPSWQNQEVPWINPYPLRMFEETIQKLALSGSSACALSIKKKFYISATGLPRPFWEILSKSNFLTDKTRIRGLKHVKGFKERKYYLLFPCNNWILTFLFVFHWRNSSRPWGAWACRTERSRKGVSNFVKRWIQSLQEREYNT